MVDATRPSVPHDSTAGDLSRRDFVALSVAAGLAAATDGSPSAQACR